MLNQHANVYKEKHEIYKYSKLLELWAAEINKYETLDHTCSLQSLGIFVLIAKNTVYGSKL